MKNLFSYFDKQGSEPKPIEIISADQARALAQRKGLDFVMNSIAVNARACLTHVDFMENQIDQVQDVKSALVDFGYKVEDVSAFSFRVSWK